MTGTSMNRVIMCGLGAAVLFTASDATARQRVAAAPAQSAFAQAAALAPQAALLPHGTPARSASVDPDAAFRRALLFPGGGHFLSGERTKGAMLLGVAAGGLLGGVLIANMADETYDADKHKYTRSRTPLLAGAGLAAGSWIYGIMDSRASAVRANGRVGRSPADGVGARLGFMPAAAGNVALGVSMTW
jgi:hypothetical protein